MNNISNMIPIQGLLNLPEKQLYFLEILKKILTIVIFTLWYNYTKIPANNTIYTVKFQRWKWLLWKLVNISFNEQKSTIIIMLSNIKTNIWCHQSFVNSNHFFSFCHRKELKWSNLNNPYNSAWRKCFNVDRFQ